MWAHICRCAPPETCISLRPHRVSGLVPLYSPSAMREPLCRLCEAFRWQSCEVSRYGKWSTVGNLPPMRRPVGARCKNGINQSVGARCNKYTNQPVDGWCKRCVRQPAGPDSPKQVSSRKAKLGTTGKKCRCVWSLFLKIRFKHNPWNLGGS